MRLDALLGRGAGVLGGIVAYSIDHNAQTCSFQVSAAPACPTIMEAADSGGEVELILAQ